MCKSCIPTPLKITCLWNSTSQLHLLVPDQTHPQPLVWVLLTHSLQLVFLFDDSGSLSLCLHFLPWIFLFVCPEPIDHGVGSSLSARKDNQSLQCIRLPELTY